MNHRSPSRKKTGERTERALYDAATELFATQGYAATTLSDIAEKCGIHKSTIFHYVRTKQDLLAEILDRGLRHYLKRLEAIVQDAELSYTERLEAALRNHLRFVFDQRQELTVFLRERKHLAGPRGTAYLEMARSYEARFREIVKRGMDSGEFAAADPHLSTLVLLGAANWMVEWHRPDGRLDQAEITEQYVNMLVHRMIAGSPEATSPSETS